LKYAWFILLFVAFLKALVFAQVTDSSTVQTTDVSLLVKKTDSSISTQLPLIADTLSHYQTTTTRAINQPAILPEDLSVENHDTPEGSTSYISFEAVTSVSDTSCGPVTMHINDSSITIPEISGNIIVRKSEVRPAWFFGLFILQLLALIYLKVTYYRRIEEYFKAYFNLNLSQQLFREQETALSFQALIMMFNFFLSCSLLIYLLLDYFYDLSNNDSFFVFVKILLVVIVIYTAKYSGYRFLELIFPFYETMRFFRFTYFMNQKLLGVLLIPFIYVALYAGPKVSEIFLHASAGLFILSVMIRSIKGVMIGAKYLRQNTFHFLIYICTFEIAPLLILVKWLQTMAYGQAD
jgi:hypothetical protein